MRVVGTDVDRRRFLRAVSGTVGWTSALSPWAGARQPGTPSPPAGRVTPKPPAEPGTERVVAGVSLRWCPPGAFVMGSPVSEPLRRADETQVAVRLTRGFWMASYEVTQGQWQATMGAWPGRPPTTQFGLGPTFPMYWVTYDHAERFCAALTAVARDRESLEPGWTFRLPTEAQWEYACRAGTTGASGLGAPINSAVANIVDPVAAANGRPAIGRACEVGSYRANDWGLCDMHGNVFEWCRDWYHVQLPGGDDPDLSATRGVANRDGSYSRVRRGGAWNDEAMYCRSGFRLRYEPERDSDHIGFRVALVDA